MKLDAICKGHMPEYKTEGSAAMDLQATTDVTLAPGEVFLMPTGLHVDMSRHGNIAALLLPRSGKGHKEGLVLGNLVGLIDTDYQGEIKVSLWNRSDKPVVVKESDRIAQIMFIPYIHVDPRRVAWFEDDTARGEGGFGSTDRN